MESPARAAAPSGPAVATGAWLPPRGVLVHVGPPKTGTTAVQTALAATRLALAEQGVLYPGGGRHTQHGHVAAALLRRRRAGAPDIDGIEVWDRFARRIRRRPDRAVVSSELLADARAEHIGKLVADLGPDDVHVLITLRPLEAILPSTWQQDIKGGRPEDLDSWLHQRLDDRSCTDFWLRHAHDELVRRWADAVGSERVSVLAVDPRQPDTLLREFEQMTGIAGGTLEPKRANRSLSLAEAEMLRSLFDRLDGAGDDQLIQQWIRIGGFKALVENRTPSPGEGSVVLPGWAVRRARELHGPMVRAVLDSGVRFVGDVDTLIPSAPVSDVVDLRDPEGAVVPVDAAAELALGVFRAAQRDFLRSQARRDREPSAGPDAGRAAPRRRGRRHARRRRES